MNLPHWITPPQFEQEKQTRLARNLSYILATSFVVEVVFGVLAPVIFPENTLTALVIIGTTLILTIGCHFLLQARRLRLASVLFCAFSGATPFLVALVSNGIDSFIIQTYTIVILIAGLLLGARYSFFTAILGVFGLGVLYYTESNGIITIYPTSLPVYLKFAIYSLVFLFSAILLFNAIRNIDLILQNARRNESTLHQTNSELQNIHTTLEQKVENKTNQLNAIFEIGRAVNRILDPDQIGDQAVKKITNLFEAEFAAIYLVDSDSQWTTLKYSDKEIQLNEGDSHRLNIEGTIELETALHSLKPYIDNYETPDKAETSKLLHFPGIRTSITLPLSLGRKVIGVINIQSAKTNAFSPDDIEALQYIASQISISFEHARLLQETQAQLSEINRLNQRYLQTTWHAFLAKEISAFHFSSGEIQETSKPDFATLETAQQNRKVHITQENGESILVAPILFQDQLLGAIKLKATNRTWTTDEIVLIEATLNQTALSLENTRLILETQDRAEQEKILSDISSRMRETLDFETILQTAVSEMQNAFQLSEVEVHLISETAETRE